jgi:hypothetical protein
MYRQVSKQSASISLILSPVALAQLGASTPKALTLDQRIAHTDPAKISSSECCTRGLGFELSEASLSKNPFDSSVGEW